jgi:hypothetical protein
VNHFWLQGEQLRGLGARFFAVGAARRRDRERATRPMDWTALRDRWEYAQVARAGLAALSFLALVIAIASAGGA